MNLEPAYPAAVSNVLFNAEGKILMLSPDGRTRWRVMGGQLEKESITECVFREIREELGQIDVEFLEVVDTHTYFYRNRFHMISIFTLVRYDGGVITPADDMEGYAFGWFSREELMSMDVECPYQKELQEKFFHRICEYLRDGDRPYYKIHWKNPT